VTWLSVVGLASLAACRADDGTEDATKSTGVTPQAERTSSSPPTTGAGSATATTATTDGGRFAGFEVIPGVVRQVEPSVVAIQISGGEGSGVVYDADGTIVTNHHVVPDGSEPIQVIFADGKRATATFVAADPLLDLAVIRADRRDLPAARFASELPEVGELAIAVGNPLGFENTVTAGVVSGLHRNIPGSAVQSQALVDLIQTDAAISPGNSGGALLDGGGEVIGVNVAYIPPQAAAVSIGFAIPAPTVTDAVGQMLATGRVKHGYLGIQPAPLTPQVVEQLDVATDEGVLILEVVPGGPAAQGGLQSGDVIAAVDGTAVPTVEDFLARLRQVEPGTRVTLAVVRGNQRQDVVVTVQDRPATGG
jgi:S1-C subfamily serine protease